MTTPWKKTALQSLLTVAGLALLLQAIAYSATTYSREKLKGTSTTQGDFSSKDRPTLVEAKNLTAQACDKITAAQQAGEWDKTGHAQRAKTLLMQAQNELKLAIEAPPAK